MIGLINVNDFKHLIIFLRLVTHEYRALKIDVLILSFLLALLNFDLIIEGKTQLQEDFSSVQSLSRV